MAERVSVCMAHHPLRSSNMSGRIKFRRDQSSARLFCSGVPVSNSLLAASYDLRALGNREGISVYRTT